ncbi:MAG: ATP-binding cassette domain-containing protein, partial [Deinococcus sp.]|nr:ATP-binding cassette domain-containing protein [Deinococcus sp.]
MVIVDNLTKVFPGKIRAVDGISFQAQPGQIFGLLGPNGAGKTTTLRILATLLRPTSGRATVAGHDVVKEGEAVRQIIGVVNGGMGLYARLTGREILHYFGQFYGLGRRQVERRIAELDATLDLKASLDRRAGEFSSGMTQKIVIARAILHDPKIIFFDEATADLDVFARRAVLDFVRHFQAPDRLAIYSTHVMSEANELCDRIAILHKGKLIAEDSLPALKARG